MKDVMMDAETLGRGAGCVVTSFAMVQFDRNTGEIFNKFYQTINIPNSMSDGLIIEGETLEWWLKQHPEALRAMLTDAVSIPEFMVKFKFAAQNMLIDHETKVWAQGADFDFPIVKALLETQGCNPPWKFWNQRDTRTAYDICGFDPNSIQREGTYHNALDDCYHQIKLLVAAFQN